MKSPRWFAETTQDQANLGINTFAVSLLAESFSLRRAQFGDDGLCLLSSGKDRKPVYIILQSSIPLEPQEEGLRNVKLTGQEIRHLLKGLDRHSGVLADNDPVLGEAREKLAVALYGESMLPTSS